jgi:hypothetical protein
VPRQGERVPGQCALKWLGAASLILHVPVRAESPSRRTGGPECGGLERSVQRVCRSSYFGDLRKSSKFGLGEAL